jgi:hypothetical protein
LGEQTSEVFKTSGEKSAETVGHTVSNLGQAKSLAGQILAMCLPFQVQFIASYFHSVLIPCGFFEFRFPFGN